MTAHTPASASVPRRVASVRCNRARGDLFGVGVVVVAILDPLLLVGEYGDTRCRRVEIARVVAGAAVVDARDVLDEVAGDVARPLGDDVVPMARARVREPAARAAPARDVEVREVLDLHLLLAASLKRPVRRDEHGEE